MKAPECPYCGESRYAIEVERRRIRYQLSPQAAHLRWRCAACGGRFSTAEEIPDEEMPDPEPYAGGPWTEECHLCGGEAEIGEDKIEGGFYWFAANCECGWRAVSGGPLNMLELE